MFPLDLIPGAGGLLPHAVLDISTGFEWHNDEQRHRREMEMLKLRAELAKEEVQHAEQELDYEKLFLDILRADGGSS